jgi:hypothetical protein
MRQPTLPFLPIVRRRLPERSGFDLLDSPKVGIRIEDHAPRARIKRDLFD